MRVARRKFGAGNNFQESYENITGNREPTVGHRVCAKLVNVEDAVVEHVESAGEALNFGLGPAVHLVVEFAAEAVFGVLAILLIRMTSA